jgi:tetratricopeptide (TPR) repeat protein
MREMSSVQTRLARYYLGRLRAANTIYRHGGVEGAESAALLGQEWAQIAQWQAWAAAQSGQNEDAARLCAAYPLAGADVLITRQNPEERVAWLNAGLAAARTIGDSRAIAVCLLRLAWATHKQIRLDDAEDVARQALAQSEHIHDRLLIGQSLHLLGEIAVRRGALEQAEHLFLRSVALLQAIDAQATLAEVYFSLSELAYFRGMPDRAHAYALECYELNQALGLNQITNNHVTWLGLMTIEVGDVARGEQYVRQSEALCRAAGAQSTLAHTLGTLAEIMLLLHKDAAQARMYAEEALQIAQQIGEAWLIPGLLMQRAGASALTGDYEAAQPDASQAVELARASGYRKTLIYTLMRLADIQIAAGELEAARSSLSESLQDVVPANNYDDIVYGIFIALKLWRRRGDAIQAAEWTELLLNSRGVDIAIRREVQSLRAELSDLLGAESFAAAAERGKVLDLATVVQHILSVLAETG